ncbi:MAG: DJ-1/PfpI family protein [Alphaproteobacteria bacterium]|jgi:transcriptional regulator GlxA family with amidase domain|nr:DJ-1/PfpI family protein [Rhodospirillaceae bacterium]MDG2480209.1 DJ-1/PfpI family protein [Alphaproteobacteria bacterium]MBT6204619.1 DJ-1/PfpI family protein [Rhodospirillaceae bacterium]MBT6511606.1 DJ-1/PfpI family protein [Rhodospirillaceae bacterium]MBT7611906.1 DJ-1/PfpI family protein [Rhodospirillaceae bacterium]
MKTLAVLVFPGFQTLDLFGPLEMLGDRGDEISITIVAETSAPVPSVHGQGLLVDKTVADGSDYDLLLIPGGESAHEAAKSSVLADWIVETANHAELVMTVCTGSILLATTGVLDGRKATTNKLDFTRTVPVAPRVEWVRQARWVEDGKFFTSSGVSAGMDMTLAAIALLFGVEAAREIAEGTEYEWHDDPTWDPFAKLSGLV